MDGNQRLQQSFESIKSERDLRTFLLNKTKEGLYLEFKQKSNSKHGKLDNDDKKNFAKALSGFANSDGGILIWGIQTRSKDESAKTLKPINKVDDFIRSLKSFLTSATQPIVDGVLIEKVSKENSNSRGYVKCLIQPSFKAPHRSTDREYYKRSIEGFYRLEHFDLEDMFGRRVRPVLKANIQIKPHSSEDKTLKELHFYIYNKGRAVAKYTGLFCKFTGNIEIVSTHHPLTDVSTLNNLPAVLYSDNLGVVHPNNIHMSAGHIVYRNKDESKKIGGLLSYYCDQMSSESQAFEI